MPDPTPPTTKPPMTAHGSELPPRLLAKLKVEIDGYELIERLGEGGQATVYKAIQKKDGQMVAVKVLHAGPHATEEARARLKREINALRAINHPNIVHAIAAGRTRSGLDCLVMNYIDGKPLDALWADPAFAAAVAPQPADLLRLFKTICETVQAAHRKGITHRDLSPSNILIDATGQPHILDFGMASTAFDGIVTRDISMTGQFIGKLQYASPEQARGARVPGSAGAAAIGGVDIRSDVYALGVMLYQLLTGGAFPYEVVGNVIDVLHNIIHSKPKPPSDAAAELHTPTAAMAAGFGGTGKVPVTKPKGASAPVRRNPPLVNETIEAIVLKALEKDPDQRYQSAGALAEDVGRYLAGQPTSAVIWSKRPAPSGVRLSKFLTRRRGIVAAASLVLVATLVGVTMNAKVLAVWLGLATVAAPILPTELAPFAPASADAAMQPDGTERRLSDTAADLARVEARIRAVNKQLASATTRKPPELEERTASSTGPMSADDFLAALAKSSSETGRELKLDTLSKEDRDREEQAEASAIEREMDQDKLLARRAELDGQQAALWSRLVCGRFTGRDIDRLFRFRIKSLPMGDANVTAKNKVLEAGVKVRRIAEQAMDNAATMLRTPAAAAEDEGGEGRSGEADLTSVLSEIAAQLRAPLTELKKAAGDARDAGNLTDEESNAVDELAKLADELRDASEGAAQLHGEAAKPQDEPARFTTRGRLQRDLRVASDAASQVDQRLVELAKTWNVEVDTASKLPDLRPAVAKRPQPPVRPTRPEPKVDEADRDTLTVGSTWSGTQIGQNNGKNNSGPADGCKIERRDGNTIVISTARPVVNSRLLWTLRIEGQNLTLVSVEATNDPGATYVVKGGKGTIDGNTLVFDYWCENFRNGKPISTSSATFTLKRDKPIAVAPAANADPLAAQFPLDSTWTGTWTNNGNARGGRRTTGRVLRHEGQVVVMSVQTTDYALRHLYIQVNGNSLKLLRNEGVGNIPGTNTPANQLTNIRMTGRIAATVMTITGTSDLFTSKGANMGVEEGTFKLTRD